MFRKFMKWIDWSHAHPVVFGISVMMLVFVIMLMTRDSRRIPFKSSRRVSPEQAARYQQTMDYLREASQKRQPGNSADSTGGTGSD